jgi:hypothetical protein
MNQRWSLGGALLLAAALTSSASFAHDIDPDSQADNYAKFWLTLEADRVGGQASAGTTLPLGPVELAVDAVFVQTYSGVVDPLQNDEFSAEVGEGYRSPSVRLELGPALDSGGFFLLPKLGLGYDFERQRVAPLVPQIISIIQGGPAYMETWLQVFLYDLFDEGSQDSLCARELILVGLSNVWALGVQTEFTIALQNASGKAIRSWPVGLRANFSPAEVFTLGVFAGYETTKVARNSEHDFLSGRVTATLLW